MADPLTSIPSFPFLCRSTALVNDIIAPLHFADDPRQQARSDHFVLAKLRCDVRKHGFAVGPLRVWRLASTGRNRERAVAVAVGPAGSRQALHKQTRMRQPDFGSQTASPPL